jgi:hypothetical protein
MSVAPVPLETLVAELEESIGHSALVRRLIADYPEELTMEVVTMALRRGHISPAEAVQLVRECNFSFGQTFGVLALLGRERGWQPHELVLEALEGQPH